MAAFYPKFILACKPLGRRSRQGAGFRALVKRVVPAAKILTGLSDDELRKLLMPNRGGSPIVLLIMGVRAFARLPHYDPDETYQEGYKFGAAGYVNCKWYNAYWRLIPDVMEFESWDEDLEKDCKESLTWLKSLGQRPPSRVVGYRRRDRR